MLFCSLVIHALILPLGCCIEYLPPYSPDYNPIKQAFSVIQAHLCQNSISFFQSDVLYLEMYQACDTITPEMTWGFFAHSGYMVWWTRQYYSVQYRRWLDSYQQLWIQSKYVIMQWFVWQSSWVHCAKKRKNPCQRHCPNSIHKCQPPWWLFSSCPRPYLQCSCASWTSASSPISIPPCLTRCWFEINCSACGLVIFKASSFSRMKMDRSNLLQKSTRLILGTRAARVMRGKDCTKAGVDWGGAVLCCSSPARPLKSFWMTMLGPAEAFWLVAARPRRRL